MHGKTVHLFLFLNLFNKFNKIINDSKITLKLIFLEKKKYFAIYKQRCYGCHFMLL